MRRSLCSFEVDYYAMDSCQGSVVCTLKEHKVSMMILQKLNLIEINFQLKIYNSLLLLLR